MRTSYRRVRLVAIWHPAQADRPRRPGPRPCGSRRSWPGCWNCPPGGGARRGRDPPEPAAPCAGQLDAAHRPSADPTPGTNRQVTVFGAIKVTTGRWMYRLSRRCAADSIALLEQLIGAFPHAPVIVVICDNDSIHHARKVTAYLEEHPRLELLYGARYSPHDNPADVANIAVTSACGPPPMTPKLDDVRFQVRCTCAAADPRRGTASLGLPGCACAQERTGTRGHAVGQPCHLGRRDRVVHRENSYAKVHDQNPIPRSSAQLREGTANPRPERFDEVRLHPAPEVGIDAHERDGGF